MNCIGVGFSETLSNARVMRAFVNGKDVVVWRSTSGKLSAWENRCPHRGMRLSHGFVRGESLACMYHGWHYGVDAKCKYIPAHPDLEPPETIQIQRYSSFEKNGIIWISDAQDAKAPMIADGLIPVRSLDIHCSANFVKNTLAGFRSPSPEGDQIVFHVTDEQEDFMRVDVPKLKTALYFIFQNLPNSKCFLHVLAEGLCEAHAKKTISRSLEHLRRTAEKQFGEVTS
jgi:nitrite reductase/ring-hydroxylating ferredoxin subunit